MEKGSFAVSRDLLRLAVLFSFNGATWKICGYLEILWGTFAISWAIFHLIGLFCC